MTVQWKLLELEEEWEKGKRLKSNTELIIGEWKKRWKKKSYNIARTNQGVMRTSKKEERDVLLAGCKAEHNLVVLAV